MAAPQIPNLNTLRTGGSRGGRGRGRGGQGHLDGPAVPSPEKEQAARDLLVQHTDLDASVSRLSAVELGYMDDPFAELFVQSSESQRRFPIINRGTYVRTTAIDKLVDRFLCNHDHVSSKSKRQIISLGAGSDTRFFRIMQRTVLDLSGGHDSNLRIDLVYHEFDFPENVAKKQGVISHSSALRRLIGTPFSTSDGGGGGGGGGFDGPKYHLHALDLRSLDPEAPLPQALRDIDKSLPTLLISECCLVYLEPALADKAVQYFTRFLCPSTTPIGIILYEPIHPNDAFGRVMVSNLASRGIVLQTLRKYGSLEAQTARMKAYGFDDSAGSDMEQLWQNGVEEEERRRVGTLEMVDEIEEWKLLAAHYCVVWAWRDGENSNVWDGWKQLETQ